MISTLLGFDNRARGGWEGRATPENPSFSLQDPAAWDEYLDGGPTDAGVRVNVNKAMGLAAFWQGVTLISADVAGMPLEPIQIDKDGNRRKAIDHDAFFLVARKANDYQVAFQFWRQMITNAIPWGNGYAYIERSGSGKLMNLLPLLPDRTGCERIKGKMLYFTEVGKKMEYMLPADVLHIHGLSADGLTGIDVIKQARHVMAHALAARAFGSKFFANGATAGGVLQLPEGKKAEALAKIEKGFAEKYTSKSNWFKTIVLRDGAKFHQMTVDPEKSQLQETHVEDVREIARILNIPPHKLGDSSRAAYNSLEQENKSYLSSTLYPWMQTIKWECWDKLLTDQEKKDDSHLFEYNTAALLAMDGRALAEYYKDLAATGVYSVNDIRRERNMDPIGPEGDVRYIQMNMMPLRPLEQIPIPGDKPEPTEQPADEKTEPKPDKEPPTTPPSPAKNALRFAIASRARHKAKNPAAFLEFIDGNLAGFRAEYKKTCGAEGEQEFFAPILARLKSIAETASQTELYEAVHAAMTQLETE